MQWSWTFCGNDFDDFRWNHRYKYVVTLLNRRFCTELCGAVLAFGMKFPMHSFSLHARGQHEDRYSSITKMVLQTLQLRCRCITLHICVQVIAKEWKGKSNTREEKRREEKRASYRAQHHKWCARNALTLQCSSAVGHSSIPARSLF